MDPRDHAPARRGLGRRRRRARRRLLRAERQRLFHLYVYPELHGQGAGSLLFERVTELAPDGFRLWVFQRNTQAREFYEHRGMRVVELTDGSRNEEREPDALYEWLPSVGT